MSFHRFLSSGTLWLTAALLLASLAGSWVAAAPAELPAGAILAQGTPVRPDISPPTKPPLPGGRPSPLRVMVPTDDTVRALQAAGITDITQISPNLDPIASFSPGPRMTLFPGRPAGEPALQAMPPTPFRTLAILVQFSDKPAQVSATFFDNLLFGTGAATVRGYYREVSYGLLDIVTVNLPSSIGWLTAPQTYSYYVNGQSCLGSYPRNCQRLTEDLVALVNPAVDFSRYDNNGDGYVDTIFVIHAGTGAEVRGGSPNIIWSHSWWTYNEPYVDGVYVGSYTTEPEFWFSPGDMTHGVYVHELAHAFGLPDLYDIDDSSKGVGDWSLMAGGSWNGYLGNSPAHPDAWSRVYLGFNPVVDISGYHGLISVPNVEQNRDNAIYRFRSGRANEYWLLENRQKIGSDVALPGSGLLIWHVDDNLPGSNKYECKQVHNYLCAAATQHFRVALEQADGALHLEYGMNQGDTGDPFPGSTGKTAFTFTSNPNSTSYYSTTDWGLRLSNISTSGGTVTVQVGNPNITAPLLASPANGGTTSDNTPTFTWGEVSGATAYRIQASKSADFSSLAINSTKSGTTHTPGTALADGLYYWRVQARGADGLWGPWSTVWTVTVDTVKPAKPTLLAPAKDALVTTNLPAFDWSDVPDAARYDLQVDNSSTFGSPEVAVTVTASTYTVTMPLPDGRYYWRVRAVDAAGNAGSWTSARTVWVDITPAPAPTLLSPADGTPTSDNTPTFTWNAVPGLSAYRIQASKSADFSSLAVNSTKSSTTHTPGTALADGLYYWRLQARGADGIWGLWSTVWTVTVDTVKPAKPTLLAPVKDALVTTNLPAFDWSDVPDAARYDLQVDNSSTFGSPEVAVTVTASTHTVTMPLPDGRYYWRVRAVDAAGNAGSWTSARTVWVDITPAPAPTLLSPADGTPTSDNTPTFTWNAVSGLSAYRIQASKSADFSSLAINSTKSSTTHTPGTALADGLYYWRVQARGADGIWGLWSTVWTVTVDTVKPVSPALLSPPTGSVLNTSQPELDWSDVADAAYYELQIDNSSTFGSPEVFTTITASTYTATTPLPNGKYYWRVRTYDAAGNRSGWTSARSFTLAYTPAPLEIATPTFTATPLALPVVGAGLVEAESDAVGRTGVWTAHQTSVASGGGYLYSSGSTDDALTLTFSGAQVSVIYVKHPALGVIVVEIDGSPLQLLDSTATDSVFGTQATFTLAEGQHTLRVYPLMGTIAIDAFLVEAAAVPTTEPEATATATDTPTPVETLPALETATPEPTVSDLPSATPSPTPTLDPLSIWLEAESDAVTLTGQWTRVDDPQASGGAYLLSSDQDDAALTLAFFGPRVDVIYLTGTTPTRFDVEVDGQIVQAVDYAGDGADFSARLTLLLSEGPHTLRLIVRAGGLGVDAFVVPPQPLTPTPTPSETPTFTPAVTLTPTPTETLSPTATPPPPTETPTPVPLPTETPAAPPDGNAPAEDS